MTDIAALNDAIMRVRNVLLTLPPTGTYPGDTPEGGVYFVTGIWGEHEMMDLYKADLDLLVDASRKMTSGTCAYCGRIND